MARERSHDGARAAVQQRRRGRDPVVGGTRPAGPSQGILALDRPAGRSPARDDDRGGLARRRPVFHDGCGRSARRRTSSVIPTWSSRRGRTRSRVSMSSSRRDGDPGDRRGHAGAPRRRPIEPKYDRDRSCTKRAMASLYTEGDQSRGARVRGSSRRRPSDSARATSSARPDSGSSPVGHWSARGPGFEVALLRDARRAARGRPVAGRGPPRGRRPSPAGGRGPRRGGGGRPSDRRRRASPAGPARASGPRTIATATAWLSVTIGFGATCASSS